MIKTSNEQDADDENIRLNYIKNLDNFLFKFIIINIINNLILYYASNEFLAAITYTLTLFYFFLNFIKNYKNYFIALFAQCYVVFLINLTYLTFIGTLIINNFVFSTSLEQAMQIYFYCDLNTYFLANIYLLFFSLSVLFFNKLIFKSLKILAIKKINLTNILFDKKKIKILILLPISFELFLYFNGIVGSQQSGGFLAGESTWYTQFYLFVVTFHILLNILLLTSYTNYKIKFYDKIFLLISFTLNLLFYGFYERRLILIFFVISFFIYFLISQKKIFTFKTLLIYIFSFFIIFQSFVFLGSIRSSYIVTGEESLRSIIQDGKVFSFLKDTEINKSGKKSFIENLRFRMFNNHELATLIYYDDFKSKNSLNGNMLLVSLIKMIPAVIYPNKKNFIAGEPLIATITESPLYITDTSDSLHSYSYADFNLIGLIIYPIIINLVFFVIYKIISSRIILNLSSVYIVAIICPLITIRAIEGALIDWFITSRNIIIFILLFNFLLKFIIQKKIETKNEN